MKKNRVRINGADIFLYGFLAILVTLTILFVVNPHWGAVFNLSTHTNPDTANYDFAGGLIIVAIACFLGALVPFPVPYIVVVGIVALNFHSAGRGITAVIAAVLAATLANTMGDTVDYLIGALGRILSGKKGEEPGDAPRRSKETTNSGLQNRLKQIIVTKPALIPVICVLFGMTPLPDSLLFMPLGLVNYPLKKLLIWNTIGKFLMLGVVAVFGILSFDFLFGLVGGGESENGWITGMVTLYISWGIMMLLIKKR